MNEAEIIPPSLCFSVGRVAVPELSSAAIFKQTLMTSNSELSLRLVRLLPLQSWIRNFVMCAAVYFGIGAVWSYYIYFCFGNQLFRPGNIPQAKDMLEQMKVGTSLGSFATV